MFLPYPALALPAIASLKPGARVFVGAEGLDPRPTALPPQKVFSFGELLEEGI